MAGSPANKIVTLNFDGMERLKPDPQIIKQFLRALASPWLLAAFLPDGPKGSVIIEKFSKIDDCLKFIAKHNPAGRNIYHMHAALRHGVDMHKTNIARVDYCHVECDPRLGESPADAKKRYLAAAEKLPVATIIVDSGNGVHFYWLLNPSVDFPPGDGEGEWSVVENVNRGVAAALGADTGTNINKLLRTPGTINWPNARKTSANRVACMSSLVAINDCEYALSDLPTSTHRGDGGDADDEELPTREEFEAAYEKHRRGIIRRKSMWRNHFKNRWEEMPKTGERSDVLHRLEHELCELKIPQRECCLLIWPLAVCKFRYDRSPDSGWRQLCNEIKEVYAEHDAKDGPGKKPKSNSFGTLSDVVEEDVRYLWKPYIPYGMVVIFEGDPKAGKSYVAMWLAARLSVGIAPDGSKIEPLNILYVTKENPEKFIFKARNRVMGGDAKKIRYLKDKKLVFDEEGLKAFEQEVMTNRPDVIVVDVLNSFVPPDVNIGSPNEIRSVMDAVADIAEKAGAALIFVRHWRKASGTAMHKGAGLVDIGATAGSVVMFARDKDDPRLHYMGHTTARASEEGPTLKFRLQGDPVGELIWEGTSDLSPDDLRPVSLPHAEAANSSSNRSIMRSQASN